MWIDYEGVLVSLINNRFIIFYSVYYENIYIILPNIAIAKKQ